MKNELNTCFNKNSPWAHTESELDVLGVHGKLVKYAVHSSKKKLIFIFFFTQAAQTTIDQFWVSRNFRYRTIFRRQLLQVQREFTH
jgi:hypothetical protein